VDGKKSKTVVVIVAHPDDETLWTGGTILSHPAWNWFVVSVCRRSDANRAPKFFKALEILKADGIMGDLDDGPEQKPLDEKVVEQTILDLLPSKYFDLIITHNPSGEYTRHIRHEEVSAAVIKLWHTGKISARELWLFAYGDGNKQYYPKADENASMYRTLTKRIWSRKYTIIKDIYGFSPNSWEAKASPRDEAFWQFSKSFDAKKWLMNGGIRE
jgi:LmbE family N-acetylglucosaminyl deacetylase